MRRGFRALALLFILVMSAGCQRAIPPTPTPALPATPVPEPTATPEPDSAKIRVGSREFVTIQEAIDDAGTADGDSIVVSEGIHTEAGITLAKSVTIRGQGAGRTIVQAHSALEGSPDRVFLIPEGADVTITGMSIRHGHPHDYPRSGGGVCSFGRLKLKDCVVSANSSNDAGGVFNQGSMTILDCTIADNFADRKAPPGYECGSGGGIKNGFRGDMSIEGSTISGNRGLKHGGGLFVSCESTVAMTNCTVSGNSITRYGSGIAIMGTVRLINCTVAANENKRTGSGIYVRGELDIVNTIVAGNDGVDCRIGGEGDYRGKGTIGVNRYSLVADGSVPSDYSGDPMLGPLGDNGGGTFTHALLPGSPAIDEVPAEGCVVATDQRGESRPVGPEHAATPGDIGAFELQAR